MIELPSPPPLKSLPSHEDAFNKDVQAIFEKLPPAVQKFIGSGAISAFIEETEKKYSLDASEQEAFGRDFFLMVLGVMSPREFRSSLVEAGTPEKTIELIFKDISEQIFARLQKNTSATTTPASAGEQKPGMAVVGRAAPASAPVSTTSFTPSPAAVRAAIPPPPNTTPLVKEYSADPYREPVE